MFTGIIQGIAKVAAIRRQSGLISCLVQFPSSAVAGITVGASVAIDGICLTVTKVEDNTLGFDVMTETIVRSTVSKLDVGSTVNFERSLKFGDEIGGHLLSGHIDGTAKILSIEKPENNFIMTLSVDSSWSKYIFPKGYIALNGASLTVASVDRNSNSFTCFLIPETLRLTTFGEKQAGELVNFEIERQTQVLVDTTIEFLKNSK